MASWAKDAVRSSKSWRTSLQQIRSNQIRSHEASQHLYLSWPPLFASSSCCCCCSMLSWKKRKKKWLRISLDLLQWNLSIYLAFIISFHFAGKKKSNYDQFKSICITFFLFFVYLRHGMASGFFSSISISFSRTRKTTRGWHFNLALSPNSSGN